MSFSPEQLFSFRGTAYFNYIIIVTFDDIIISGVQNSGAQYLVNQIFVRIGY
jgi:hypothetical protein